MKKVSDSQIDAEHFSSIAVPAGKYWGMQTQLALTNFNIGNERFPRPFIRALGIVKYCCAISNIAEKIIDKKIGLAIVSASLHVVNGEVDNHFPLSIWQSGSGTQSHMNANEVIANLAMERLSEEGENITIHPNDHCNLSQSTNDTFPTAMHIATVEQLHHILIPSLTHLYQALFDKSLEWSELIKIGRTHLQDAAPLTLGQEFSGYAAQIELGIERIEDCLKRLYPLAQGGTAVGTGLNSSSMFADRFVDEVKAFTGLPFTSSVNKFESQGSHDAMVELSGVLNIIAVSLNKIANDIRLLGSGPRSGIGELHLPENEPGSSMMPGKVNPTQCEAVTMVCAQVMGNLTTVTIAGAQGQLEMNAFKPVIIHNVLQSIRLIGDAAISFSDHCISGLEADIDRISELMEKSLMLVTILTPIIGYDKAASIVRLAHNNGTTLRQEAITGGFVTAHEFDSIVRPENMIGPK
ncbi:MAG: fumarate hydratase class II [Oleiphilaceae bacterium]|jgi:fumarate hydratase class II